MLMFFVSLKTWCRRCHTHNLSWYHWRVSCHVELVSSQRKDGSKWWRCYRYKAIHLDKYHLPHTHVAWRKLKPRRTAGWNCCNYNNSFEWHMMHRCFLHWRITSQSQPANPIFDLVFYDSLFVFVKVAVVMKVSQGYPGLISEISLFEARWGHVGGASMWQDSVISSHIVFGVSMIGFATEEAVIVFLSRWWCFFFLPLGKYHCHFKDLVVVLSFFVNALKKAVESFCRCVQSKVSIVVLS